MKSRLAVIIPVYRESAAIGPCLNYLSGCPEIDKCEVIVVDGDGGSTRTPRQVIPLRIVGSPPGRGIQLNTGAGAATAAAMLFLHVDTFLPRGFVALVVGALKRFPAGAFDLHIVTRNPLTAIISFAGRIRSRITLIPYGDQAQFIRKSTFDEIGGFPNWPIMEDVAIMHRIKTAGHRISLITPPARTSDRRWRRDGAVRRTLGNWRLMLSYRSGVSPAKLARRYRPYSEARGTDYSAGPAPNLDLPNLTSEDGRGGMSRVILFYRALRLGEVKSRLAAELGEGAALALYRGMLLDIWSNLREFAEVIMPYVDDPNDGEDLIGTGLPQRGNTLEERMDNAFRGVFGAGAMRAVLIGSDIPDLGGKQIREALAALESHDAVIAASEGGGYNLIGFRRERYRPLFMHNGTGDLYQLTIGAMIRSGLSLAELPTLRDIDTVKDLIALYRINARSHPNLDEAVASHVPQLLSNNAVSKGG